jgi:hypothetical protein
LLRIDDILFQNRDILVALTRWGLSRIEAFSILKRRLYESPRYSWFFDRIVPLGCNYTFETGIEHYIDGGVTNIAEMPTSTQPATLATGLNAANTLVSSPGDFYKFAPANGASISTDLALSWTASSSANGYLYCYDTTNNNTCDTNWNDVGTTTALSLGSKYGVVSNTTYYWQVRAYNPGGDYTEADGGTWWSFTTLPPSPGEFYKSAPANGASTATDPALSWTASSGANDYLYCYDITNNNTCDTSWVDVGTTTSAYRSGLSNNMAYYWQVIAGKSGLYTYADGGAWWSFTTDPSSHGNSFKNASANGLSSTPVSRYFAVKQMFFPSIVFFGNTGKKKEPFSYSFRGIGNTV